MDSIKVIFQNIPYQIKIAFLVILSGFIFYILFQYLLRKWFLKIKSLIKGIIVPVELLYGPIRFLFPSLCLLIMIPFLSIPTNIRVLLNHFLAILFIVVIAWLIIRIFAILKVIILSRYKLDVKDNLKARQINTQLSVIQRVLIVIIFILFNW